MQYKSGASVSDRVDVSTSVTRVSAMTFDFESSNKVTETSVRSFGFCKEKLKNTKKNKV